MSVKTKKCKKCNVEKSLDEFVKNKSCKDGRAGTCLDCWHAYQSEYYQKNKDRINKRISEYQKAHPEKSRERTREWRAANRDKVNAKRRKHRANHIEEFRAQAKRDYWKNPEKARARQKKWRDKNKDKIAAKNKAYREQYPEKIKEFKKVGRERQNRLARERRKIDPKWKLQRTISNYIYQTLKGRKLNHHWEDLVGYTLDELIRHLENQFDTDMTWANHGEWHIDHIVPIDAFNFITANDIDFKRCWALENLRPIWAKENESKGAKLKTPFQPCLAMSLENNNANS